MFSVASVIFSKFCKSLLSLRVFINHCPTHKCCLLAYCDTNVTKGPWLFLFNSPGQRIITGVAFFWLIYYIPKTV